MLDLSAGMCCTGVLLLCRNVQQSQQMGSVFLGVIAHQADAWLVSLGNLEVGSTCNRLVNVNLCFIWLDLGTEKKFLVQFVGFCRDVAIETIVSGFADSDLMISCYFNLSKHKHLSQP